MKKQFLPRVGRSVFDCKFCGAEGMQWLEIEESKWRPFDIINNCIHFCESIKYEPEVNYILEILQNIGFEVYTPRTSTWSFAFIASNDSQTLYFLIRKNGIDFKLYDYLRAVKIDKNNKIYTDGGSFVRNSYEGSELDICKIILDIAHKFILNEAIEGQLLENNGASLSAKELSNDMLEIFNGLSNGDGEDVYLSDGVWLCSDGTTEDRGR